MVAGVEMPVESDRPSPPDGVTSLQVRHARAADDQPRRRRAGTAGIAQGARAVRLSGARAARRGAQPAVRTAVGRPERSARRASLVPQQDQEHRRRARPAQGRHARRHHQARSLGLLRRCDRDRPRDPGRDRDARSGAAASAVRAVRRRFSRRPGDRPQPGLQRLADRAAAPLPRLPRRAAGASRRTASPDDEAFCLSGEVAAARAVRPARPRDPAERACAARPNSRGRGASGGDGPAVRGRRPRLRATSRRVARSEGADRRSPRVQSAASRLRQLHRARLLPDSA